MVTDVDRETRETFFAALQTRIMIATEQYAVVTASLTSTPEDAKASALREALDNFINSQDCINKKTQDALRTLLALVSGYPSLQLSGAERWPMPGLLVAFVFPKDKNHTYIGVVFEGTMLEVAVGKKATSWNGAEELDFYKTKIETRLATDEEVAMWITAADSRALIFDEHGELKSLFNAFKLLM